MIQSAKQFLSSLHFPFLQRNEVRLIKYAAAAALRKAIPEPATRPETWFSTAYPADSEEEHANLCSAEYQVQHGHCLLLGLCHGLVLKQLQTQACHVADLTYDVTAC